MEDIIDEKVIIEKKKAAVGGDHDQEEANVDKFFELITSFREARNRLRLREQQMMRIDSNKLEEESLTLMKEEEEEEESKQRAEKPLISMKKRKGSMISWVPSFEREDFTAEVGFRPTDPSILPAPSRITSTSTGNIDDAEHDGLNLNLNLTL